MIRQTSALIAIALAGACASAPAPTSSPSIGRPAIVIAAGEAAVGHDIAAYVRIVNPSSKADRLVGVSCACADTVEIHNTFDASMHVLPNLDLPAGAATDIRPGGPTHLMLMGMRVSLDPGESVRLILTFESGAKAEADFLGVANSREGWASEEARAS